LAGITELAMFLPIVMRCSKLAILALTPHWSASGVLAALHRPPAKFNAGNAEEDRRGVTQQSRRSHFVSPQHSTSCLTVYPGLPPTIKLSEYPPRRTLKRPSV